MELKTIMILELIFTIGLCLSSISLLIIEYRRYKRNMKAQQEAFDNAIDNINLMINVKDIKKKL